MFNCREGIRRKDGTLPKRLLSETVPSGPTKGETINLHKMIDDYYALLGRDLETGIPSPEKLKEMRLDDARYSMKGMIPTPKGCDEV